ncbi:MAG: peptide ABC transporter substrate-binding protein, partial [Vulcanimicrobiaceae bacterium]
MRRSEAALGIAGLIAGASAKPLIAAAQEKKRHPHTIPHTLRYTTGEDITTLNPYLGQQLVLSYMSSLTMAWLVRYDAHNRPVPELATVVPTQQNGGISKDGLRITFHLRKGVVWSDGAPFDARDVIFSWKAVMNPANNVVSRTGFDLITRIDSPDPHTAVFHLKEPYSSFLPTFFGTAGANPCILPQHLLADQPNINNVPYNNKPIGIGPFVYSSWQRASQVELVPNERYWRGKPKLEKVVFKIIPDRNTALTQLTTHEVDMWLPIPSAYYDRVKQLSDVKLIRQASYLFGHFDFNLSRPPYDEHPVREAIRYAINREELRRTIGHGIGIIQESPTPPTHPMFDPHIKTVPFDLAKANAILDGAGWKRGSDGIRAKNGKQLNVNFASSAGTPDVDARLELIRAWWKEAGIGLDVRRYVAPMLFGAYADGGVIYTGKFDVVIFSWVNAVTGDYTNLYDSKQIPPNGQNDLRWRNAIVDKALAEFRHTYDASRQKELCWTIQEQFVKDIPSIVSGVA